MTLAAQIEPAAANAAELVRRQLRKDLAKIFRNGDLLVDPVSAGPPPRCGEDSVLHLGKLTEFRRVVMPFIVQQDLAGIPACAVRAGFGTFGLPIGIQFSGPTGGDCTVLRAAEAFHALTGDIQRSWPTSEGTR